MAVYFGGGMRKQLGRLLKELQMILMAYLAK